MNEFSLFQLFLNVGPSGTTEGLDYGVLSEIGSGRFSAVIEAKCCGVRQNCRWQRENLALQRAALKLRRDWHHLPDAIKREYFSKLVVDRRVAKLIASVEPFEQHR